MLGRLVQNTFKVPQLWGAIIPMHIVGCYGLWVLFSGEAPSYWWIYMIMGYIGMKMIGIAAGYHRLFCHRAFEVIRPVKLIILWLGTIAGQGSAIAWCSIHRGYHHRYADTDKDLHSPKQGIIHSYILWMFKYTKISIRSTVNLQRDNDLVFAHKYYLPILWCSHAIVALISFKIWLFLMAIPALLTLHCFLIQTSLTHVGILGYRNFKLKDDSVNVWWLWPIILGECWHNNHHRFPRQQNFGVKWWELDPTAWIIKIIRKNIDKTQTIK